MKILVYNRKNSEVWTSAVRNAFPDADVRHWVEGDCHDWLADYAVIWQPPAAFFQQQTQLKAVFNQGVGVDSLVSLESLPADLPVFKLRGVGMEEYMSDYVTYGLLHFYRDFDLYRQHQSDKQWQPHRIAQKSDWTVGILGLGVIGKAVAEAVSHLGFPVIGWSRSEKTVQGVNCVSGKEGLDHLLRESRVLVSLLPSTPSTHKLLNQETLTKLPEGGVLINGGRGDVIDIEALQVLLKSGHMRGAMLDVFEKEPLEDSHPFWNNSKVMITPHIAAPTPVAQALEQIVADIALIEQGEMPPAIDKSLGY
ncbi:2-hydroxyacid dehydrogenase [Endozoicomonas arenosclerae]|uniref:2-hydroxyacid dehydrogenase n=1 Tax=Endozoicomonas arenosclerae TaxID=1633495 RepID=UPI000782CFF3|nr:glyoxylate/hydroxypyruvate reductase A [Endozoicomonas arenosclerae]